MTYAVDSSNKKFKLSYHLRNEIQDALERRMIQSIINDVDSAKQVIRNGFVGTNELTDHQLIEDYIDWHGLYDEGDVRRDSLMCRIIDEQGNDAFEREFLK